MGGATVTVGCPLDTDIDLLVWHTNGTTKGELAWSLPTPQGLAMSTLSSGVRCFVAVLNFV
jgi:hypothetical protein